MASCFLLDTKNGSSTVINSTTTNNLLDQNDITGPEGTNQTATTPELNNQRGPSTTVHTQGDQATSTSTV